MVYESISLKDDGNEHQYALLTHGNESSSSAFRVQGKKSSFKQTASKVAIALFLLTMVGFVVEYVFPNIKIFVIHSNPDTDPGNFHPLAPPPITSNCSNSVYPNKVCKQLIPTNYVIANSLKPWDLEAVSYRGKYFDVLGPPITYRYSETFWTSQTLQYLPPDLIKKFDNKVFSISGYEIDIVRKLPDGTEEPVPSYEHYNHHYGLNLFSKFVKPVNLKDYVNRKYDGIAPSEMGHIPPNLELFSVPEGMDVDIEENEEFIDGLDRRHVPTIQWFAEGNGNEMRTSFHGYPQGYGQLIDSPTAVSMTPMMINMEPPAGYNRSTAPLPKTAIRYDRGLNECPCTDRITRVPPSFLNVPTTQDNLQDCGEGKQAIIQSKEACWKAIEQLNLPGDSEQRKIVRKVYFKSSAFPPGCSYEFTEHLQNEENIFFKFELRTVYNIQDSDYHTNNNEANTEQKKFPSSSLYGQTASSLINWSLHITNEKPVSSTSTNQNNQKDVILTLIGPLDKWFAIGLNATSMADEPYAIVVAGNKPEEIMERRLGNHNGGMALERSLKVLEYVEDKKIGNRTIVLSLPMIGLTKNHFSFDWMLTNGAGSLNFINAIGGSLDFKYHVAKGGGTMYLAHVGEQVQTSVCKDLSGGGSLAGNPFPANYCSTFNALLQQQHNPVCDAMSYDGGLKCCIHLQPLLDKEQDLTSFEPVTIHMKVRFYYEERQRQKNLFRFFTTVSPEHSIPQAPPNASPQQQVHMASNDTEVSYMLNSCDVRKDMWCFPSQRADPDKGIELIYAAGHCHAPACIMVQLINLSTGELICENRAYENGQGDEVYREKGFQYIPPCVWGHEKGLKPPPILKLDTRLRVLVHYNSSVAHFGVMGHFQMRASYVDKPV